MDAENQLYADVHGKGQEEQPAPSPPLYTPTPHQPTQGYPPYGPPTTVASPYYAAPSGAGYGGGYAGSYGVPPQQQQQVTVVTPNSPVIYAPYVESYSGAIFYSCVVFWCCNWIFGLIGFLLAMMANDKAVTDAQGARSLARASYIVSTVGIGVTIIILVVYFTVLHGGGCTDTYGDSC